MYVYLPARNVIILNNCSKELDNLLKQFIRLVPITKLLFFLIADDDRTVLQPLSLGRQVLRDNR